MIVPSSLISMFRNPIIPPSGVNVQEDGIAKGFVSTLNFLEPDDTLVTVAGGIAAINNAIYARLLGRNPAQTLAGGTLANQNLTLKGSSAAGVNLVNIDQSYLNFATAAANRIQYLASDMFLFSSADPRISLTGAIQVVGGNANYNGININRSVGVYLILGNQGTSTDGKIGLVVDMGGATSPGSNAVLAIAGHAIAKDSTSLTVAGLDFISGVSGSSIPTPFTVAYGARTQAFMSSSGKTLTDYIGWLAKGGTLVLGTLTNWYGFKTEGTYFGTNRLPFWEDIAKTGDLSGNRFRSNSRFGSVTGDFGGGDGVVSVADASTNPGSNPTVGFLAYGVSGAVTFRTSNGGLVSFDRISTLQALAVSLVTKTANYTMGATDTSVIGDTTGGAFTVTLPAANSKVGRVAHILKSNVGINALTVAAGAGDNIEGVASKNITTQFGVITLISDGVNTWYRLGGLSL